MKIKTRYSTVEVPDGCRITMNGDWAHVRLSNDQTILTLPRDEIESVHPGYNPETLFEQALSAVHRFQEPGKHYGLPRYAIARLKRALRTFSITTGTFRNE